MFCRYCGASVPEGARFCRICGAPLNAQAAAAQMQPQTASARTGAYPAQPKKRHAGAVIAVILAAALLVTGFGWPGFLRTLLRSDAVIHTAEVTLPEAGGARGIVEQQAAVAVEAYLVARAYYDKLEHYDLDRFDPEEYAELLDRTVKAFRAAGALSAALEENAAFLTTLEDQGVSDTEAAVYRELAAGTGPSGLFSVTALAAEDSAAMKWAQDITGIYDKAPVGRGVRTLAEELGTDAKHAYAMLTQAQAIIAGEAMADADMYNAAYQTAVETKAAASAAGFAVAVAASGGAAAGLASALEVGGVVCGGVSAVLDIGTAVTIHTTNGEGNEYTAAFEKTAAQFAPINAVFALGNAGVNAYNIYKGVDVGNNTAQALIYVANSLTDYCLSGSILGGTFTHDKDGVSFTLTDTLLGTDPKQKEAVKNVLTSAGISPETADEAMRIAAQGHVPAPEPADLGSAADQYIEAWDVFTDPNEPFDAQGYIGYVREQLSHYGQAYDPVIDRPKVVEPGLHPELPDETDDPTPAPTPSSTPSPTPEPEPTPKHGSGYEEGITGSYHMLVDVTGGGSFEYTAQVLLHDNGKMEISFGSEHLVGTYDPSNHTFVGMGDVHYDDPFRETFWNYDETSLTFDPDATPVSAFGIMVPTLSIDMDLTAYIELYRLDD